MSNRIVLCCLLWLLAVPAGAEPLRLVTGDDYPPFAGKELPNQGLATEIVQRTFLEMGHDTEVAFMPWKRGFREAKKGSFVGTFPYGKNEERQREFHYSRPLYVVSQHFFVLADSGIDYRQDEDLQGRRVCIPIGYNPVKVNKLVEKGIVTLDRPVSIEDCFEMLDRGRTDLVRITDFIGWAVIDESFGTRERFSMLEKPVREAIEHLIVSKDLDGGEAMVAEFDAALERLEQEGVIGEMKRRHLQ